MNMIVILLVVVVIVAVIIWYYRVDNTSNIAFIGTFTDKPSRAMTMIGGGRVHSFDEAVAAARASGKKYMGLQSWLADGRGGQVFVSDGDYDKYGANDTVILDATGHKWGGPWTNAVYELL